MGRLALAAAGAVLLIVILVAGAAAGIASMFSLGSASAPSQVAAADIPPDYLALDIQAAATCPGLPWAVLAGIGKVESDFGRAADQVSSAGALGPMQFLPATFNEYAEPVPPGGKNPPTPWDPVDAVYAAARMLCANGARGGANIPGAIFAYNHSDQYVADVLSYAAQYTSENASATSTSNTSDSAITATAVAYAEAQLGVPYEYGGEGPAHGQGFDCSGLTQAAYASVGISLPRTAEEQFEYGEKLPAYTPLEPGDLVFFGSGEYASHVGIYVGNGMMVDAPHTGAFVRLESYSWSDYLGATRPTARS